MDEQNLLEWKEEYKCGIKDIDKQHETVINIVNELYLAIEKTEGSEKILKLVDNLDFYTTIHFDTEEKYAEKYDFPEIEDLKERHNFFKKLYEELRFHYYYYQKKYYGNEIKISIPYPYQYALHLHSVMRNWLLIHMNTIDKKLIEHIKACIEKTKK